MGFLDFSKRQKRREQQDEQHPNSHRNNHESWKANLRLKRAQPLGKVCSQQPEWLSIGVEKREELSIYREHETCDTPLSNGPVNRYEDSPLGFRVSFPVKFGLGLGTGGRLNSTSPTLRLIHVKFGSESSSRTEDSAIADEFIRQRQLSQSLARNLDTASGLANAASVLLLSQAFYGPIVSIAITCLAGAGFTRFIFGKFVSFVNRELGAPYPVKETEWPRPLSDFSTASFLLSIGIPILRHQLPELYWTFECLGVALPVAMGYAQTTAQVETSSDENGALGAKLWRQRHRWASRRLCRYLSDFQSPSALGWLVDTAERISITIIPNVLSDKTWVIGSAPLPIRATPKLHITKAAEYSSKADPFEETSELPPMRATLDLQSDERAGFSTEYRDGQQVVPTLAGVPTTYRQLRAGHRSRRRFRERLSLLFRGCYLLLIFGPLIVLGPVIYFISTVIVVTWGLKLRSLLWRMLLFSLEKGGAAFIKWGQWSASREDLFPEDLCQRLGRLCDQAPEHSYSETRKVVFESFGRSIEDIFEDFPKRPRASGSIAQVYQAKLKCPKEDAPAEVAVKVRHPSVALRIHQDFLILGAVASWAQNLPALRWLKLRESVEQFSHTLTAQADLRVEAKNLARFRQNFESLNQVIIFPRLVPDLISEGVLVESFERGQALHEFLKNESVLNTQIVAAGVDTYLKMLLTDNFLHTDLHAGNIMARSAGEDLSQKLQLVLLDFGLAQELSPAVRYRFLSFMMMIGSGNGERAAHHLLEFAWPQEQTCANPELLVEDVKDLFERECDIRANAIDLNKVLIQVLQLCRKHEVVIDSEYASLVVAVCVLVGFARSLDPELSIMDAAVPCLFFYNFTGRIMGQIYG